MSSIGTNDGETEEKIAYNSIEKQVVYLRNLINGKVNGTEKWYSEVKNTISWYSDEKNYKEFNEKLREQRPLDATQKHHLNILDNMFRFAPPVDKDLKLYRGVKSEGISDKSFISTSMNKSEAESFTNRMTACCMMEISVSKGSKILPIAHYSDYPDEEEVLIDRNQILMTTYISKEKFIKTYYISLAPRTSIVIENQTLSEIKEEMDYSKTYDEVENKIVGDLLISDGDEDFTDLFDLSDRDTLIKELEHLYSSYKVGKMEKNIPSDLKERIIKNFNEKRLKK